MARLFKQRRTERRQQRLYGKVGVVRGGWLQKIKFADLKQNSAMLRKKAGVETTRKQLEERVEVTFGRVGQTACLVLAIMIPVTSGVDPLVCRPAKSIDITLHPLSQHLNGQGHRRRSRQLPATLEVMHFHPPNKASLSASNTIFPSCSRFILQLMSK